MRPLPITNGIPVPEGRPLGDLIAMLDGPVPERWAAFEAVARTPGRQSLDALVTRTRSDDPFVRRAAIAGICIHELGRHAGEVVRAGLADRSPYVVRTACDVVGAWKDAGSHSAVAALLASPDPATRQSAIKALAGIWQPTDFEPVFDAMLHDGDEAVRKRAAWTLRANPDSQTWERLFHRWSADPLPRHRQWSCELAEALGDARALPALDRLAHDPNGHVRSAAGRARPAVAQRVS
jgi:HEAT repeat protein